MAWLARPTPHRLGMVLSLVLVWLVALPETATAKHRRPLLRTSLAGFAIVPPPDEGFSCRWNEDAPVHDYECWLLPGQGPPTHRLTQPELANGEDPSLLVPLLQGGANYHDHNNDGTPDSMIEGWEGPYPLAHPDIAPVFTCGWEDANADDARDIGEFQCQFSYRGYVHTFAANEIVSVEYDPPGGGDQFFVPCHRPPAPCVALDLVAPDTSITDGPSGTVRVTRATFGFSSSEAGSIFECRLDGGAWRSCSSPRGLASLLDGAHHFEVRAGDAAGNVDKTPAERDWRIDTTGPRMGLSRRPVRLSRRGVAKLLIRCLGEDLGSHCSGSLTLRTAQRVRSSQRGRVALGRKRFRIASGRRAEVSVKLSQRHRRLVARLGRLRVRATVRALDRLRNVAETSQVFYLRAPRD